MIGPTQRAGAGYLGDPQSVEQQAGGYRQVPLPDTADLSSTGVMPQHAAEQGSSVNRGAQVAHVVAEYGVELVEQLLIPPHDPQPVLVPLADLIADLGRDLVP